MLATSRFNRRLLLLAFLLLGTSVQASKLAAAAESHYLYVASPGVRDYLEYGGHGLLVFDIDAGHKFVKRISTAGFNPQGKPLNAKGVCASAATGRLYISTLQQLMCLDLASEKVLWERKYPAGCDRMSITPDGQTIYLPSLEGVQWYVVRASDGEVVREIVTNSGAHNTICGPSGKSAYLAGLKSPLLRVADVATHAVREVGPFSAGIRPFTIDSREQRVFVNVNELLGFEIGDLQSGKMLARVEVQGFARGPVKRHGCPSHGVGLTPDEKEVWVVDAANKRVHLFDLTVMPPKQLVSIELRDEPGWITFSLDGRYAWPSTGDVIDVRTRQIVARLTDEQGRPVMSEKMIQIDVVDGRVARVGDQFGVGREAAP
jgi:hypothetical protein